MQRLQLLQNLCRWRGGMRNVFDGKHGVRAQMTLDVASFHHNLKGGIAISAAVTEKHENPDRSYCKQFARRHQTSVSSFAENITPTVQRKGAMLTVKIQDEMYNFHSVWLRHNCHCPACKQQHSGQWTMDKAAIAASTTLTGVKQQGDEVQLTWSGGHSGHIPLSYLQHHAYSGQALDTYRQSIVRSGPTTKIPEMEYADVMNSKSKLLEWLLQINESGVSILKNVPTNNTEVLKVASLIAPPQFTIYGEAFEVVSTPSPINVAYSTVHLDLHMDLVYYESCPGLQLLHCVQFDDCVTGGESTFLDVFFIAEEFRSSHPKEFQTLVEVPATFQKVHYNRETPVHMVYQQPHISLNHNDEIIGIRWAPAFEGPLAVKEEDVEPYYEAYEAFSKAIRDSPYLIEQRLQVGDLVVFNNRTFLHGRHGFDLNGGVRKLQGCYVHIDHFKSQVKVHSNLVGDGRPAKRVGNFDWS